MNYQSPFSYRYGSSEMRSIFSEEYKYLLWRRMWVALSTAQYKAGIVSKKELADIVKNEKNIDIRLIYEIEKETKHDVVAAIKEYSEKCKIGGGKIHMGATSMDIVDNADTIKIFEAIDLVEKSIVAVLKKFSQHITCHSRLPCMGYTHLQPAEPTTVGYRLAFYAQDLIADLKYLQFVKKTIKAKGFKGAVGTSASYISVGFKSDSVSLSSKLGVVAVDDVTTQVSTRKYDYFILSLLASVASSCAKFAGDLRILQSPMYGEWSEPFAKKQVGSSAMPFKKNPITSENICSLARYVVQQPVVTLENATHSNLERTLDDSANRRVIISESFLAVDQILMSLNKIVTGLVINKKRIALNLARFAPFTASEAILMEAVRNGGDRQLLHERLRKIAMHAWSDVANGKENPMAEMLKSDSMIAQYISSERISELLDVTKHIGDAPKRARQLARRIDRL